MRSDGMIKDMGKDIGTWTGLTWLAAVLGLFLWENQSYFIDKLAFLLSAAHG